MCLQLRYTIYGARDAGREWCTQSDCLGFWDYNMACTFVTLNIRYTYGTQTRILSRLHIRIIAYMVSFLHRYLKLKYLAILIQCTMCLFVYYMEMLRVNNVILIILISYECVLCTCTTYNVFANVLYLLFKPRHVANVILYR